MHKYFLLLLTGVLILVGSACARESRQSSSEVAQINLTTIPYPPILGESRLVIQILDKNGAPIDNAQLDIKGDMTHAGMVPILAEMNGGGEEGYYNVPIEWTMGGDWIIRVKANLPDGSTAEERFDLRVTMGEDKICGEELVDE